MSVGNGETKLSQVEDHFKIVDFLNECEEENYVLDMDNIRHILKMDFDYIRKQNHLISDEEVQEILKYV